MHIIAAGIFDAPGLTARIFSTSSEDHPAFYPMGTAVDFLRVNAAEV
jgi:hypothetical protein